jgi:hypothetical protein
MATLYRKLPSIPIPTSLPNASLTYNFKDVTISGKSTMETRFSNIESVFPGYKQYINKAQDQTTTVQLLTSLITTFKSDNITYYDTVINSTILYKINFIHVGVSPIDLSQTYSWCVMLDLVSSSSDTLLIIIPIKYVVASSSISDADLKKNEIADFSKLIYNCNNPTMKQININTFMLPINFTTFYKNYTTNTTTNRVIILNSTINTYFYDIVKKSRTNFQSMYINDMFKSSIYDSASNNIEKTIYICPKVPIIQVDVLKNDIYIDCYKVGESDKVVGGIKNPSISNINAKKGDSDTSVALFGLILAFVILYLLYKLIKMITCKTNISSTTSSTNGA